MLTAWQTLHLTLALTLTLTLTVTLNFTLTILTLTLASTLTFHVCMWCDADDRRPSNVRSVAIETCWDRCSCWSNSLAPMTTTTMMVTSLSMACCCDTVSLSDMWHVSVVSNHTCTYLPLDIVWYIAVQECMIHYLLLQHLCRGFYS